jgi:hypothetical protein
MLRPSGRIERQFDHYFPDGGRESYGGQVPGTCEFLVNLFSAFPGFFFVNWFSAVFVVLDGRDRLQVKRWNVKREA